MTIQSSYDKSLKRQEKFLKSFGKKLDKVLKNAEKTLQATLSRATVSNSLDYDLLWREILKDAGYYKLIDTLIVEFYDSTYKETIVAFKAGGINTQFTKADVTKIKALKKLDKEFFSRLADDVGLAVKRQIYKYAISNASIDVMADGIRATLATNPLSSYSNTYARTAIGNFQQEIIDLRAANIENAVWVYVGVQDNKTRDFCNSILDSNKYYDYAEKSILADNPERAWNCRHRFYALSEQEAKVQGYVE